MLEEARMTPGSSWGCLEREDNRKAGFDTIAIGGAAVANTFRRGRSRASRKGTAIA